MLSYDERTEINYIYCSVNYIYHIVHYILSICLFYNWKFVSFDREDLLQIQRASLPLFSISWRSYGIFRGTSIITIELPGISAWVGQMLELSQVNMSHILFRSLYSLKKLSTRSSLGRVWFSSFLFQWLKGQVGGKC